MTNWPQSGAPKRCGKEASLRKRPWGTCTQLEKVSHTLIRKQCVGGKRQQIRAAPTLNSIWRNSMDWDEEPNVITRKRRNGSARRLSRESPMHSITWVCCTKLGMELR